MSHLLCFGMGFSARALAARLAARGWTITGTSRSAEGWAAIRALGYRAVAFGDAAAALADATHVVISAPPDADGDPVLRAYGPRFPAAISWLAYLSTTGVYGDHGGQWVTEETPLTPNTERGVRRVAAETAWLKLPLPVHRFRLAGIYGPGRNALLQVLDGTAKRIIKPGQVFSRVHVEDIATVLETSMARPNPGRAYNVCDDEPCPPQEVVTYAAQLLGLPLPPEIPFAQARLSPMAQSFYADSKRVCNARIKQELGVRLAFPTYRQGLEALLADLKR
jgi:nucleoside-diphosphate-sugar epimerase